MDEKKDRIKSAIEKMEPADGAKERMLANIKRKAENQNIQEILAKEPKKSKILSFNRVMKWALPVAACLVVVVLAGAFLVPNLFAGKYAAAPNDAPMDGELSREDAQSAPRSDDQNSPAADKAMYEPSDREPSEEKDQFTLDGHVYSLSVSILSQKPIQKENENAGADGDKGEQPILRETNEGYEIAWSDGTCQYLFSNRDGATKEEILAAFESKFLH